VTSAIWAATALVTSVSAANAQVVLNTAASQQYPEGSVLCSAVNVGPQALDISLEVINLADGTVVEEEDCTGDASIASSERCVTATLAAGIYFCRVTIDLPGGSNPPSPLLAMVRQWVRATIVSFGPAGFTALPAE
jgi:hypothetical protein